MGLIATDPGSLPHRRRKSREVYTPSVPRRLVSLLRTDMNSRLRALTASLAFDSLEEARSQTSRTRVQSSEAVAVR